MSTPTCPACGLEEAIEALAAAWEAEADGLYVLGPRTSAELANSAGAHTLRRCAEQLRAVAL